MIETDFDLNMLRTILALYEERSVTSAALRVGATQPTLSRALARLRIKFDDPLLVRTSSGLQATSRFASIAKAARSILADIDRSVLAIKPFNAKKDQATFTFALDEQAEMCFFPKIMTVFAKVAPHTRSQVVPALSDHVLQGFESGEIDLAIGAYPMLERRTGYFHEVLYTTEFFCVVRADKVEHVSAQGYLNFRHAVVIGSEADFMTLEMLRKADISERNFITVSRYATLPSLIEKCPDIMATVVCPMGVRFANKYPNLRIVKPPFPTDQVIPRLYWHNRFHHDPQNRWLRDAIRKMFRKVSDAFPSGLKSSRPRSKSGVVPVSDRTRVELG